MSKLIAILNKGEYVPWERPITRSCGKVRAQNRLLPDDAYTCWDLNSDDGGDNSIWQMKVPSCAACALFQADKGLLSHLRVLTSNKQAPFHYRCLTPWCHRGTTRTITSNTSTKRKSGPLFPPVVDVEPPSAPVVATITPPKKKRGSPPSHNSTAATLPPAGVLESPPSPSLEAQTLTEYLMRNLSLKEEAVLSLTRSNKSLEEEVQALQERNGFLNETSTGLEQLVWQVRFELDQSDKQVTYLKRVIVRKVHALKVALDLQKSSDATSATVQAELTTFQAQRLAEICTEKTVVASLKTELATAYVSRIPVPETLDHLAAAIERLVTCTSKSGCHLNTKVKVVCELMLSTIFDGKCKTYLLHRAIGPVKRKNPYRSAMQIAKVIDLNGSVLNLSGYDALRKGVEGRELDGYIERNGGWLTSKYFVMKAMSAVETAADAVIPFHSMEAAELEDGIDGIVFEYPQMLAYLLKLFRLDVVAGDPNQPPVQFSITLDGADLSQNISHVTAGIKINDPRAVDPISGIPIGMEDSTKVQSRELCFPLKVLIAKDTKELYHKYFADFFLFFQQVEERGFGEFQRPFIISSPQDLSSFWKCYGKGGACKQRTEFCHICACRSAEVHLPRAIQCERCVSKGREKCYHWPTGDPATLIAAQERLNAMTVSHPYLADTGVYESLRVRFDDLQLGKTRDVSNIDYVPTSSNERRMFSEQYLNHDLSILQLSLMGSTEDRRTRLKAVLRSYKEAQNMAATLEAGNYTGAYITLRQGVPCILHLENRVGEKKIKMVLLEGYDALPTDTLKTQFLKDFENLVNSRVLGTPIRQANWRISVGKDKDNRQCIKDQTLPNTHVRKFLSKFEFIATLCIADEPRRAEWNATIHLWNDVIGFARKRENFDDDAIEEFQTRADDWWAAWMSLVGRDGITNYTHIVSSGHLSFYMKEWGNLYRYSQQGWEAYNSLIKSVYYRRTQRGGHGGKKDEASSRVKPLGRWMQRKLFFLSGDYLQCENDIVE
jgi:hypothetical protein